jgi:hypothetical protein
MYCLLSTQYSVIVNFKPTRKRLNFTVIFCEFYLKSFGIEQYLCVRKEFLKLIIHKHTNQFTVLFV